MCLASSRIWIWTTGLRLHSWHMMRSCGVNGINYSLSAGVHMRLRQGPRLTQRVPILPSPLGALVVIPKTGKARAQIFDCCSHIADSEVSQSDIHPEKCWSIPIYGWRRVRIISRHVVDHG